MAGARFGQQNGVGGTPRSLTSPDPKTESGLSEFSGLPTGEGLRGDARVCGPETRTGERVRDEQKMLKILFEVDQNATKPARRPHANREERR